LSNIFSAGFREKKVLSGITFVVLCIEALAWILTFPIMGSVSPMTFLREGKQVGMKVKEDFERFSAWAFMFVGTFGADVVQAIVTTPCRLQ
jgi:hypothetical protein